MDSSPFRVFQWNARGIRGNRSQLVHSEWYSNADIILIQETLLTPGVNFSLPGFNLFRRERPGAPGGGLLTAVANRWAATTLPTPDMGPDIELLRVDLVHGGVSFTLINMYVPHGHVTGDQLSDITDTLPTPYFVAGDWNVRHPLWDSSASHPTHAGSSIYSWLMETNCVLLNTGSPTHVWGGG